MPDFSISFEVFCAECGAGLCNQSDTRYSRTRHEPQVTVAPCQHCLDAAEQPLKDKIAELESKLEDAHLEIQQLLQT